MSESVVRYAEAIPIYPKAMSQIDVIKTAKVEYRNYIDGFTSEYLLCESDDGLISWVSLSAKRRGLRSLRLLEGGRKRVHATWHGEDRGTYVSFAKASEATGYSDVTIADHAKTGKPTKRGWRFEYV